MMGAIQANISEFGDCAGRACRDTCSPAGYRRLALQLFTFQAFRLIKLISDVVAFAM